MRTDILNKISQSSLDEYSYIFITRPDKETTAITIKKEYKIAHFGIIYSLTKD